MNIRDLLRQAEEMQERMRRELSEVVVESSVGGGMVRVKMNGHRQLVEVKLDPEVLDPSDLGMLEDLLLTAVNDAGRKIERALQERLGDIAASMPRLF